MYLHQVNMVSLQPPHRCFQLRARCRTGAAIELGHQKGLPAVAVFKRLSHSFFAHAFVVVPAVIEEVDSLIERRTDDVYGLRLGNALQPR